MPMSPRRPPWHSLMNMRSRLALLCCVLAWAAPACSEAWAQQAAAPPAVTPPPPYEEQLLRLSELMGALHYLRGLCGAADGSGWRDRMAALMDGEGPDEERRARLAGAFNRGYRAFQTTYRSCNPSAEATIRSYLDEGRRIARDVGSRYGN